MITMEEGGKRKWYLFHKESMGTLHWYEAMKRSVARARKQARRRERRKTLDSDSTISDQPPEPSPPTRSASVESGPSTRKVKKKKSNKTRHIS